MPSDQTSAGAVEYVGAMLLRHSRVMTRGMSVGRNKNTMD